MGGSIVYSVKKVYRGTLKQTLGIVEVKSQVSKCSNCLYYSLHKVCQVHLIKVNTSNYCEKHTKKRRHAVLRGGSVSPR